MAYTKPLKLKLKVGALHQSLGVPQDEKIPETKLESALGSSSPLMKKRATMAKTMQGWKH